MANLFFREFVVYFALFKRSRGAPSAAKAANLVRASFLCQFGKKHRPAVLDLRLKANTRGTKRQPVK